MKWPINNVHNNQIRTTMTRLNSNGFCRIKLLLAVGTMSLAIASSAFATFIIDTKPGGDALNLDNVKDSDHTDGTVGSVSVHIETVGNADFASGNATIKPAGESPLVFLNFTPNDPNAFSGFSFRGQLEEIAGGSVQLFILD